MNASRPRLMGTGEIQRRLLLSRQRVQQLADDREFPEPYQELLMGRVWLEDDIEAWIQRNRPDKNFAAPGGAG